MNALGMNKPLEALPPTVEYYKQFCSDILHTGSRVICDPPPEDTDDDYLLLIPIGQIDFVANCLSNEGWEAGGSLKDDPFEELGNDFRSYKHPEKDTNIILTASLSHFETFVKATRLCKALNLTKKEDRVTVFQAINRNCWPDNLEGRPLVDIPDTLTPSQQVLAEASKKTHLGKTVKVMMDPAKIVDRHNLAVDFEVDDRAIVPGRISVCILP